MSYTYTDKIKFAYTPNFDAFNRLRVSEPLTLFDSSHRYRDNDLWATSLGVGSSATFNANQGLVDLTVGTSAAAEVFRETYRVFSYQPGKSLLVLNTFVFNVSKTNLVQRVGYFDTLNGVYLELNDTGLYFVKRSSVTGVTINTPVIKTAWNVDPMDGTGPSGISLDITKAQIFWADYEWLGVGSVRVGFVINGEFYTCHVFHHANIISTTYITTASLPCRYEIYNTGVTSGSSVLKQICTSVLSEGGYELRGTQRTATVPITTPLTLTVAGTYYPIVSLRLKASRLNSIVVPTGLSVLPASSGNYSFKVVSGGTTTGGSWNTTGADSSIEYNVSGASFTGGTDAVHGFFAQTNQASSSINIVGNDVFRYQLQRNPFTSTPLELTLCVASDGAFNDVYGSIDWEEISR